MVKEEFSESETTGSSSSDNEPESHEKAATEYERERQSRIADNKARMEALGLRSMAISLMGSSKNPKKRKGKSPSKRVVVKEEEDDEYNPNGDDYEEDDSGGDFSDSDEEFDEKTVTLKKSASGSGKVNSRKAKSIKDISVQKSMDATDFMDEDEALIQAIALSLKDTGEISGMQHCGSSQGSNVRPASANEKEDNTKRRKRKSLSSRVQMTADDLIIHFCQFDEVGKGSITIRDLQRMASIHDFTWTDKEIVDMIRCFDSDKDGKLTLDDFRNIAMRCGMFQGSEIS